MHAKVVEAVAACGLAISFAACRGELGDGESEGALSGDPSQDECGFELQEEADGPIHDPCSDMPGVVLLLDAEFVRMTSAPSVSSQDFTAPDNGVVCIKANNFGVAAADIALDGEPLFTPDDFNPHVAVLAARREVTGGTRTLEVRLASKPGTSIRVEVRFAPTTASPTQVVVGAAGMLEIGALSDDPDPFSPKDANGVRDQTVLAIAAAALQTPGSSSGQFQFVVRAIFEIAGGPDCAPVRAMSTERPVAALMDEPVAVTWDGRDGLAELLPDGRYYYRARVELVRLKLSNGQESMLDEAISLVGAVTIDNTAPTVAVLQPQDGALLVGTRAVAVAAEDESGVASTSLEIDAAYVETKSSDIVTSRMTASFVIDTGLYSNGVHSVRVAATDVAGNVGHSLLVGVETHNSAGFGIASVDPPSGAAGTIVTITGSGFEPGNTDVRIGTTDATILHTTTTGIRVRVRGCGTTGTTGLAVQTSTGSASTMFTCLQPRARVAKGPPIGPVRLGYQRQVVVKFVEGSQVRVREGRLVTLGFDRLDEVLELADQYDARALRMFYSLAEDKLAADELAGQEQNHLEYGDLNLHIELSLPSSTGVIGFANTLNELDIIELALPTPFGGGYGPAGSVDPPNPTTDLTTISTSYRSPAEEFGIDADFINNRPGGRGEGVVLADVQGGWFLGLPGPYGRPHEDLFSRFEVVLPNEQMGWTLADILSLAGAGVLYEGFHGLQTAGVIAAEDNGFGWDGIASDLASYLLYSTRSPMTEPPDEDLSTQEKTIAQLVAAIGLAGDRLAQLGPHEVLLLEVAANPYFCIPELRASGSYRQSNAAPVTCISAVFDAVQQIAGRGVVVVEPAGNGRTLELCEPNQLAWQCEEPGGGLPDRIPGEGLQGSGTCVSLGPVPSPGEEPPPITYPPEDAYVRCMSGENVTWLDRYGYDLDSWDFQCEVEDPDYPDEMLEVRCFNREFGRNAGTIMVGAGHSPHCYVDDCFLYEVEPNTFQSKSQPLSKHQYSNFGDMVDLQAWGDSVATTGCRFGQVGGMGPYVCQPPQYSGSVLPPTSEYNFAVLDDDIWSQDDILSQSYTLKYSGTSSASAIVAGAIAAVQGVAKDELGAALDYDALRDLLKDTGTPWVEDVDLSGEVEYLQPPGGQIGPQPDLRAAYRALTGTTGEEVVDFSATGPHRFNKLISADLDADGLEDFVFVDLARELHDNVFLMFGSDDGLFSPEPPLLSSLFDPPIALAAGPLAPAYPPGLPDLVIVHEGGGSFGIGNLTLFQNRGDRTFEATQFLGFGQNLRGVVLAELGGEKIDVGGAATPLLDLAWTSNNAVNIIRGTVHGYDDADVIVLPGAEPIGPHSVAIQPSEIVAADFNGDGALDLVVGAREVEPSADAFGDLLYYEGGVKGRPGGFAAPVSLPGSRGALAGVRDLEAADVDGDGNIDLVVGGAFASGVISPSLRIYYGAPSEAMPFEGRVDLVILDNACCTSSCVAATRQASADLNGDGKVDFIVGFRDPILEQDLPGIVVALSAPGYREYDVAVLTNTISANDLAVADVVAGGEPEIVFVEDSRFGYLDR